MFSHIPPADVKMNGFVSNTNGTGVFLLKLNWYLDRRETSPTLVCIRPNLKPGEKNEISLRNECHSIVSTISSTGIKT
jgi:hypothetical protein